MNKTRTYKNPEFGDYTVTIDDSLVKIDCYTLGSLAGGTGTECAHTVGAAKRLDFFNAIGIRNSDELLSLLDIYEQKDWSNLHSIIIKFETDSYVWFETDWSDSIEIKVTISGDAKVGATLTAAATATSTKGTFPVSYEWFTSENIDPPFHLIESASNATYVITPTDLGNFVSVIARSSDGGVNSSNKWSNFIGPII